MPALAVNTVNPDDADFDHTGERMFRAYALCPMRRDRYPGPWGVHPAHATRSMRGKWRATATAQITGRSPLMGLISALAIRMPAFARTLGSWARKRPADCRVA